MIPISVFIEIYRQIREGEMKRIAHIIDNLDRGGSQSWLLLLADGLRKRGYKQKVYCLNEKFLPEIVERFRRIDISVDIIGRPKLYAGYGFFYLFRELRSFQPDLVLTILPYGDLVGRIIAHFALKVPIVSSIQTRYYDKFKWLRFSDKFTAKWVDKFIFVAKEIISYSVENEGVPEHLAVAIPNAVNTESEYDDFFKKAKKESLNIPAGCTVFGMISRLAPQKGQAYLIEAFAEIYKKEKDIFLLLVGDGPDFKKLRKLAERKGVPNQVCFLGDRSDVNELLAVIDIFVHPSLFEGLPHAVMEAMGAGKPVIASAVDGVSGIIDNGENGFLVEPEDLAGLTGKMTEVLHMAGKWSDIGSKAREYIKANHSVERMVSAYDDCFRECMGQKSFMPSD